VLGSRPYLWRNHGWGFWLFLKATSELARIDVAHDIINSQQHWMRDQNSALVQLSARHGLIDHLADRGCDRVSAAVAKRRTCPRPWLLCETPEALRHTSFTPPVSQGAVCAVGWGPPRMRVAGDERV